jgi:hypothetical protein
VRQATQIRTQWQKNPKNRLQRAKLKQLWLSGGTTGQLWDSS